MKSSLNILRPNPLLFLYSTVLIVSADVEDKKQPQTWLVRRLKVTNVLLESVLLTHTVRIANSVKTLAMQKQNVW